MTLGDRVAVLTMATCNGWRHQELYERPANTFVTGFYRQSAG